MVNYTGREFQGFQLAPFNFAMGQGGSALQIGAVNYAGGTLRGAQISLINIADSIVGTQIGLINIARKVHGVQIGFVNLADESDASIGLLNFIKKGVFHFDLVQDLDGFTGISLSMGGKYVYVVGQFSSALLGKLLHSPYNKDNIAMSFGLGVCIPLNNWFIKTEFQYGQFSGSEPFFSMSYFDYRFYGGVHIAQSTSLILGLHFMSIHDVSTEIWSLTGWSDFTIIIDQHDMGLLSPFIGIEFGW